MMNTSCLRAALLAAICILPGVAAAQGAESALQRVLAPWSGDLDGIAERRMLRILVVMNRTHYFVDRGTQRGLAYDAGMELEKFLDKQRGPTAHPIQVVFVPVPREQILDALIQGRGDIAAANLTITPARLERVDFARPFITDVREVVATAKGKAPIATAEDLAGQRVFVRRSSSYFASLTALNLRLEAAGRKPVEITAIDEQLEDEDLLEMVGAGLLETIVVDDHLARFWSDVLDNVQIHPAAVREGGEIAWALRKGSPQLKAVLDEFAGQNRKGSYFTNVLLAKYLRDNKWVRNSTGEAELNRFRNAVALFRTYGDQFDIPWLLLAAQAYQESQIDQSKQNPSGAVGVMQIKPSTAAGAPILITGVDTDMAKNIEAGAKYLRFIVDRYYADESMDRVTKALFAVASYNAGPARIRRLRNEASQMGLDPNRWFGNVELVAAKRIGRETVNYVSNIYKYYVTYQLIVAQQDRKTAVDRQ